MGIFDKILRSGEGKKLKALQSSIPDINALEPEMEALDDAALKAKTGEFRQRLDNGEDLDDLLHRGLRRRARGRQAGARPAPLRRPADRRRRPPLRLDRRDEDRRGQDPRLDPAGLPQRPHRQGLPTSSRSTTTWPAATPSGWAGSTAGWASASASSSRATSTPPTSASSTPPTSPTARTTSSASTTSATTWR